MIVTTMNMKKTPETFKILEDAKQKDKDTLVGLNTG